MHSSLDQVVQVQALTVDIALCSWARHFILTVPLSTLVYKWVPANLMLGKPCNGLHPIEGGVEIPLVASHYKNRDKLQPGGPLGLYADFIYYNLVADLHNNEKKSI